MRTALRVIGELCAMAVGVALVIWVVSSRSKTADAQSPRNAVPAIASGRMIRAACTTYVTFVVNAGRDTVYGLALIPCPLTSDSMDVKRTDK